MSLSIYLCGNEFVSGVFECEYETMRVWVWEGELENASIQIYNIRMYLKIHPLLKTILIKYDYKYIQKVKFPIFIFEYTIFGEKYLNIRIYYNIRYTLVCV